MRLALIFGALSLLSTTPTFAADCDRNDYGVKWFESQTGASCEYWGDEYGKLVWTCTNPRLSPLYFRFLSQDGKSWPESQTEAVVCFSDTERCTLWYEGHCTCDECAIDHVFN